MAARSIPYTPRLRVLECRDAVRADTVHHEGPMLYFSVIDRGRSAAALGTRMERTPSFNDASTASSSMSPGRRIS